MDVAKWVVDSGRAKYLIAADAGIARTTLDRAIADPDPVRLGTLKEIAYACGVQLTGCGTPLSCIGAALAVRSRLEANYVTAEPDVCAQWLERLQRWAGAGTDQGLIEAAARALNLGAASAVTVRDLAAATEVAMQSEDPWALSGAIALDEPGVSVLWVSDVTPYHDLGQPRTPQSSLVVTAPAELFQNSRAEGELRLASPLQVLLDCLSLESPLDQLARREVKWWR